MRLGGGRHVEPVGFEVPERYRFGSEPEGDPGLEPQTHGLTPEIMAQIPARELLVEVPGETLADALPHLRETY